MLFLDKVFGQGLDLKIIIICTKDRGNVSGTDIRSGYHRMEMQQNGLTRIRVLKLLLLCQTPAEALPNPLSLSDFLK